MLRKALCLHVPRAATITNRDCLVRASSRIKASIGLGVIVNTNHMENVCENLLRKSLRANTSLENV